MRRLIIVLVVVAAIAAAVAGVYYARVDEKFQGYPGADQFVDIAPGTGSRAIGRALVDAGVVRDELTFRMATYLTGTERELKAGNTGSWGRCRPRKSRGSSREGTSSCDRSRFPKA